jgi:hypothetical protein
MNIRVIGPLVAAVVLAGTGTFSAEKGPQVKTFRDFGILFTYPSGYKMKVRKGKAKRIILDGEDARVGITIIDREVRDSLDDYALESMEKGLKEKGYSEVRISTGRTVLLPFRHVRGRGSAFRARYIRKGQEETAYVYIFIRGGRTFMVSLTDKRGDDFTFAFFLETFRIED